MKIAESELIINPDGSIYHLNLLPEDIAPTVILVGDPNRVKMVSKYFDSVEVQKDKREFVTHTGTLNGKRISVVSSGIGPDNIDIVLNELDALVNIDLKTRTIKDQLTSLNIVRIGTSGSLQPDIKVNEFVLSEWAIGFDSLLHYYVGEHIQLKEVQDAFVQHANWYMAKSQPYVVSCSKPLADRLTSDEVHKGFTGTNVGFYGPQGRVLRLPVQDPNFMDTLASFSFKGKRITNLEMETSAIYGMANLLGHQAVSMNCIIANRPNGTFSSDPKGAVDAMIQYTLGKLTNL